MSISRADAKMHLCDYVRDDDMDASIEMMLESFMCAQKFIVRKSLYRSFPKCMSSSKEDCVYLLLLWKVDRWLGQRTDDSRPSLHTAFLGGTGSATDGALLKNVAQRLSV